VEEPALFGVKLESLPLHPWSLIEFCILNGFGTGEEEEEDREDIGMGELILEWDDVVDSDIDELINRNFIGLQSVDELSLLQFI